ncbi:MAG: dual specificity protein phosphatase family protein [Gallionella sp.]|nr:dual specificity protein phosphatase family protein [Gallionella sp.]
MNIDVRSALTLDGLGVSFGSRVVLDDITLSLVPDGIDVLMGPVKTGKSTLFRTLSGLYEGHSVHKGWGEVTIAGLPLTPLNRPALVPQHAKSFDLTLLQALLQPSRETEQRTPAEWRDQGVAWLTEYGLGDCIGKIDKHLCQCSARVQRSVLILAQALLKPALLLIDEPTHGLNEADSTWLIARIKQASTLCKMWIALHNQMQARQLADRIVLIGGGHLLAYQDTTSFFLTPANEWVVQFLRSGSLSLPSPGAAPNDLEPDSILPPPLSPAAQQAIAPEMTVCTKLSALLPPALEAVTARSPLPPPTRNGVELASMVGEVMLRDSSAPRGFNWIIPGRLAGCPAPGVSAPIDYDLNLLTRVGITRLITLTEDDLDQEALQRHRLTNTHLPIIDREAPSIGQTHMLLMRMQKFFEAGEVLAVHCKAGLGRTGTILAAWLIRDGGQSAECAISRLRRVEPGFIQSAVQEEFLHLYEADITGRMI